METFRLLGLLVLSVVLALPILVTIFWEGVEDGED